MNTTSHEATILIIMRQHSQAIAGEQNNKPFLTSVSSAGMLWSTVICTNLAPANGKTLASMSTATAKNAVHDVTSDIIHFSFYATPAPAARVYTAHSHELQLGKNKSFVTFLGGVTKCLCLGYARRGLCICTCVTTPRGFTSLPPGGGV